MDNTELRSLIIEKIQKLNKSNIADISHLFLDLLLDENFPEEGTLSEDDRYFLCFGIADIIAGD